MQDRHLIVSIFKYFMNFEDSSSLSTECRSSFIRMFLPGEGRIYSKHVETGASVGIRRRPGRIFTLCHMQCGAEFYGSRYTTRCSVSFDGLYFYIDFKNVDNHNMEAALAFGTTNRYSNLSHGTLVF
jgi:hypothetical protein